ncbi:hypothetical protein ACLMJK_006305 [Lecanora helva]
MYRSQILSALFCSCLQHLALAQYQLTGTLIPQGTEIDGLVAITIENTSTGNYSVEARNNLFDDASPYQPLVVKDLSGKAVKLVGTQAAYGPLTDDAFVGMSPGTIWQRVLNMTEYIPPDATATKPYSKCFSVSFPDGIYAVNTTDFQYAENLATGFLKGGSVDLFIKATPLHLNITVGAGQAQAAAVATATVGLQAPASIIPGTATGMGGAAATDGSTSIDSYLSGAVGIFAKEG